MTKTLDIIYSYWIYWMFLSFGLAVIGFFILLARQFSKKKTKSKYVKLAFIFIGQLAFTWIIFFGLMSKIQGNARDELKEFLSQSNLIVLVNGNVVDSDYSEKVIKELRKIRKFEPHHSSSKNAFEIRIISKKKTIDLSIEQDSDYKNEYWVYWDKYIVTKNNEIGRIRTDIFE